VILPLDGDSPSGVNGDQCPGVYGTSTEDRLGCLDSDADGWSNPSTSWGADSGADAFPGEVTQHADADGDGYGDNPTGFQADMCPEEAGASNADRYGCSDDDGDGWSNEGDAFPTESTQHADTDSDGYGDSIDGFEGDSCPQVPGDSNQQKFGCADLDGDGWDDETDAFPQNSLFWSDGDGDSYPDQQNTDMSDDCPTVSGTSTNDRLGCLDSDGDGWSDEGDAYPNDSMKHAASSTASVLFASTGLLLLAGVVATLLFIRRKQTSASSPFGEMVQQPPMPKTPPVGPPLPPEGLPHGWTLDQWAWYGEDYLKNR